MKSGCLIGFRSIVVCSLGVHNEVKRVQSSVSACVLSTATEEDTILAVARWLELFIAEVPLLDVCHLGTRVLSKYLHVSIIDGALKRC